WRGNALKAAGRTEEAIAAYRAAIAARSDAAGRDSGVGWFSLANLKTYRFAAGEIARMEALAERGDLVEMDRVYLHFALA
ncbi:hypothetical protein ABTM82_20100, partial [Acinetobacter baumannii]